MKLIVGLGNPGDKYANSRHNIGFSVVKAVACNYKIPFNRDSGTFSVCAQGRIGRQNVILAMPVTFMNLSGTAVRLLFKKYKIGLDNLLVVSDDLDLECGRLRLKAAGSSAGHRGLKSIIDELGSQGFARLRIGIGRPGENMDTSEYVLSGFNKKEKELARATIENASACCLSWLAKGVSEAMNIFNKRKQIEGVRL